MSQKELLPHALVTAMMLLTVLGTVGCMTRHQAVTTATSDIASTIDRMIDPAKQANDTCEDFGCEP